MQKIISMLCVFIIIFSFSACSIAGLDPQTLISPPQANEDQQAIYQLLTSVDGEMNFIYPKKGEYRSAVVMHDFNGDGINEAVGLSSEPDGGIELTFMFKKNRVWEVVSNFKNAGTQVDRIMFADFSGDGVMDMIVGWGSPLSMTATISVYSFSDGKINESNIDEQYNEFAITDFNEDGIQELFIATVFASAEEEDAQDKQAIGKLFSFDGDEFSLQSMVSLSNSVVIYNSCTFTKINKDEIGLVLEGVNAEGSLLNEIITINNETLLSPLSWDSYQKEYNYFLRPANLSVSAKDVNGDGYVEFPKISLQKPLTSDMANNPANYNVDWLRFSYDKSEAIITKRNIFCTDDNFVITVPSDNNNIVCLKNADNSYEISEFFYDSNGEFYYKQVYMRLKTFTNEEWDNYENQYYKFLFKTDDDKVLTYKSVIKNDYNLIENIKPKT